MQMFLLYRSFLWFLCVLFREPCALRASQSCSRWHTKRIGCGASLYVAMFVFISNSDKKGFNLACVMDFSLTYHFGKRQEKHLHIQLYIIVLSKNIITHQTFARFPTNILSTVHVFSRFFSYYKVNFHLIQIIGQCVHDCICVLVGESVWMTTEQAGYRTQFVKYPI